MRIRMCIIAGMLLLVALLLIPSIAFAQDATATRTLPAMPLDPGERFTVQIDTDLFNGAIIEVLPAELTYAGSVTAPCTMIATYQSGLHQIEFVYLGALPGQCTPTSFTYDLICPMTEGTYPINGTITDMDGSQSDNPVGGDTDVIVQDEPLPPAEDVVINEFISDPDGTDECIELYNKEATPVDLTGWSIQDGTGQPDSLDGLIIPAGGYLALQQGTDFDFQLNNGGDLIDLMKGAAFVDTIAYGNWDDGNTGDNAPAPGSGESAGRWPNGIDSDVDSDDFVIFDNPPGCGPSCGAANACAVSGAKSIRTLPDGCVAPGAVFDVSVYVEGIPVGGVKETLPAGVTFVGTKPVTSIVGVDQNGQLLTLGYMLFGGPGTLTFELQAPMAEGQYMFNGIVDGTTGPPANEEMSISILGDQVINVCTSQKPQVMFAAAGYNVNEGDSIMVEVKLSKPGTQTITVEVEPYDKTAVNPDDYTGTTETLAFTPGDTSRTVVFGTNSDALIEGNETFGLRLINITNADMGAPNDIDVTIIDDPPTGEVWDCPLGDMSLIAPYPNNDRPIPAAAVNCDDIQTDVGWFIIAWLEDEAANTWQTYNTQLPLGSRGDLTQILPGEYYYVVVSEPGHLWWD